MEGVVFDMDGVLTDTEKAWLALFDDFVGSYGKSFSAEEWAELHGCSEAVENEVMGRVLNMAPGEVAPLKEAWVAARPFSYAELAFDRVFDLVRWLRRQGLATAIASSSARENVERMMAETGSVGLFDAVVAGDEVCETKPSPDVYLKAAEHLGIEPTRLLAIDDTPVGVQAAVAAGMTCVRLSEDGDACGAAAVCRTPEELSDKVKALVNAND